MIVRRVRPEDWPQVRELSIEAVREAPLAVAERPGEVADRPDARWRDRVAHQAVSATDAMFVAEESLESGSLVGMSSGLLDGRDDVEPVFYLHHVYVRPAFRGLGVARRLTALVLAAARALPGVDEVVLYVDTANDRALRTYAGLGFVDSGEVTPHPLYAGESEHVLRLALH